MARKTTANPTANPTVSSTANPTVDADADSRFDRSLLERLAVAADTANLLAHSQGDVSLIAYRVLQFCYRKIVAWRMYQEIGSALGWTPSEQVQRDAQGKVKRDAFGRPLMSREWQECSFLYFVCGSNPDPELRRKRAEYWDSNPTAEELPLRLRPTQAEILASQYGGYENIHPKADEVLAEDLRALKSVAGKGVSELELMVGLLMSDRVQAILLKHLSMSLNPVNFSVTRLAEIEIAIKKYKNTKRLMYS